MRKKNFNVIFMMLVLLLTFPVLSYGQGKTITGTVTSADDNTPLPGASVVVKGTSIGTATDFDGNFTLEANTGDVLVIGYIGYVTQEVTLGDQSIVNIALAGDAEQLDDVVVIGYGTKSKKLLSSAISSVSAKELNDQSVADVGSALQGKTAGVAIQTADGQPGAAPNIVIRGGSSINKGSSPLFIIDGIQRSAEDFNPDDIESMQVLKDAAASAI